jgi:hypothetical protein
VANRPKSKFFKGCRKEGRVLEAITAPVGADKLMLDTFEIKANGPTEQHIEILKWYIHHVGAQNSRQCLQRNTGPATPSNAFEVAVKIKECWPWCLAIMWKPCRRCEST